MRTTIQQRFGRSVRNLRRQRDLTQEQLGERSNMSREHISYIENGRREPCLVNIGRLASALGVTVSELMQGV